MLFLAFAFSTSSIIFEYKLVLACGFAARTIVHLLFALIVTVGSYGLALLAMVKSYASGLPLADALYGVGFACATLLSVGAGTLVAPRRFTRGFAAAAGLTAIFPAGLFLDHGLAGDWRPVFLWYLAGSLAGSVGAMRLLSRTAEHHRTPAGR